MQHDFSKPSHVTSAEELKRKQRLPIYMLILIGLFLVAMLSFLISHTV